MQWSHSMPITRMLYVSLTIMMTACAQPNSNEIKSTSETQPLGWLHGCWMSADQSTYERWDVADASHAFGSNFSLKDGKVSFFEHMRIEPSDMGLVFQAYPAGNGPSGFPMLTMEANTITFANEAHDYPQKITYTRKGSTLSAQISLLDDTNPTRWSFVPCEP